MYTPHPQPILSTCTRHHDAPHVTHNTVLYLGPGPLGQKVAKNAFSWHPFGEHLVCGLFERHIGTLAPKKVPKRKTSLILRKRVICDYLLLNCITAKTFEILNSAITKTTCIMRKSTKKLHIRHLNSFSISRMVFELYVVKYG